MFEQYYSCITTRKKKEFAEKYKLENKYQLGGDCMKINMNTEQNTMTM